MVASRMPWGIGVAMCWVLPLSVFFVNVLASEWCGEPARVACSGGAARCVDHLTSFFVRINSIFVDNGLLAVIRILIN